MHIHHFRALEKEMGMKENSLEGFSTSEHFHDHIQLKRIDSDREFSADTLSTSGKKMLNCIFIELFSCAVSYASISLFCSFV